MQVIVIEAVSEMPFVYLHKFLFAVSDMDARPQGEPPNWIYIDISNSQRWWLPEACLTKAREDPRDA